MTHLRYGTIYLTLCGRPTDGSPLSTIDVTMITEAPEDACPICQSAFEREQYCKLGHVWPLEFVDGQACQCGQFHLVRRPDTGVIFVVAGDEFIAAHADEIAELHPHRL
jgi:hypothetical protein